MALFIIICIKGEKNHGTRSRNFETFHSNKSQIFIGSKVLKLQHSKKLRKTHLEICLPIFIIFSSGNLFCRCQVKYTLYLVCVCAKSLGYYKFELVRGSSFKKWGVTLLHGIFGRIENSAVAR